MKKAKRKTAVVILAAGRGTRMRSDRAKVLHEVGDKPMILHVIETALQVVPADRVVVVVGHQAETVRATVSRFYPVCFAVQAEQRGTGHAVGCAMDAIADTVQHVVILCGDVPLLKAGTIEQMIARHYKERNALTLLAVQVDQPEGYGRVLCDASGQPLGIIEEADADEMQKRIRMINSGIYCVDKAFLAKALGMIRADNAQGEYYLTDIVGIARNGGQRIGMQIARDSGEVAGINTMEQLEDAAADLLTREG